MKRLIFLICSGILLTGCNSKPIMGKDLKRLEAEELNLIEKNKIERIYITDSMKTTIEEINELADKYKDTSNTYDLVSININDINQLNRGDVYISNGVRTVDENYFDEIVEVLDRTEAVGIKKFVDEYSKKNMGKEKYSEKIGNTVVSVRSSNTLIETYEYNGKIVEEIIESGEENHIEIILNIVSIRDSDMEEVYERVAEDRYIFGDIYYGDKLINLEFYNTAILMGEEGDRAKVKYNMLFEEDKLYKSNILVRRGEEESYTDEDMEVFMNLLSYLEIEESEKPKIVDTYKRIFNSKIGVEKFETKDYKIYLNGKKGGKYRQEVDKYIYMSLEKKS